MADATSVISKALWICENLYKYCVAPDGGKRTRETGAIAPAGTLKNFRARFAFLWASEVGFNKRFFTEAAVRLGILKLLEKKKFPFLAALEFPTNFGSNVKQKPCSTCANEAGETLDLNYGSLHIGSKSPWIIWKLSPWTSRLYGGSQLVHQYINMHYFS